MNKLPVPPEAQTRPILYWSMWWRCWVPRLYKYCSHWRFADVPDPDLNRALRVIERGSL